MGPRSAQEFGREIETWPAERLRAWQTERLREVVAYARKRVPFYRRLWNEAGLGAGGPSSLADLQRLPIVYKRDLVEARSEWVAPRQGPVGFSTRGTSGEPLLVWLSPDEQETYLVPTMRGFRWAGFRAGMSALLMSPVWHRLAACEAHSIVRMGGRCGFFWGSMGAPYIDSFLDTLRGLRPDFLTTTAPFLLAVIRYAEEAGVPMRELFGSLRSIVAVGLPLTPRLREHMRERTGAGDVFERSGTQEGAALDDCAAHDTPHVHEDVCYLEVVDEAGRALAPGRRGSLLVTKLATGGSIFVRYNTEDIAAFVPGQCRCGCGFRRLKIYGRPESSVAVGDSRPTAYDVRLCVEEDPALIGRNLLLVRDSGGGREILNVAIEGSAINEQALRQRLRERLAVKDAAITWLGGLKLGWGFRQVVDRRELGAQSH